VHGWIARNGKLLVAGGVLFGLLLGGTLGVVINHDRAQLAGAHPEPAHAAAPGAPAPAPTLPAATHHPGSPTEGGQPTAARGHAVEHKGQKREHGKHKHRVPTMATAKKKAGADEHRVG
jgi:hypothetical protein